MEVKKSRSYRDLEVWKLSINSVKEVYNLTGKFPASENFGLTNQIRKAAVSIPSNIAEGRGRNSPKEFRQYLAVSLGSIAGLETQLIISRRTDPIIKNLGQDQKDDQESCWSCEPIRNSMISL